MKAITSLAMAPFHITGHHTGALACLSLPYGAALSLFGGGAHGRIGVAFSRRDV